MLDKHRLLIVACLLIARRSFVSSAPHLLSSQTAILDAASGTPTAADSSQDESVRELERLKPHADSLSVIKTHSSVFSNINGQKEQHSHTKEEVDKNGEVLARLSQEIDKSGSLAPHVKTALDIPSKNIHKVMEQGPKEVQEEQTKRNRILPPPQGPLRLDDPAAGLRYSPLDMAEYIYWTGDEKGVTSAIEDFLQNGLMTRDEAIGFLQDIKQNLDYMQAHYNEDRFRFQQQQQEKDAVNTDAGSPEEQEKEISKEVENAPKTEEQPCNFQDKSVSVEEVTVKIEMEQHKQEKMEERSGSELSEVRQQIQENLNKKSDLPDGQQNGGMSEEDYEDILERLRVADLLYNEYSLEEVIYQLAKLMFTQSLTRGSVEAQDALQKFTGFLELEAQQGRISRALEKKVLDVLIASLSDTLTEHPELVNTARESLGVGVPGDQMPFMTQPKSGSGNQNEMDVKPHRFQTIPASSLKKTLLESGLQDQDKKTK